MCPGHDKNTSTSGVWKQLLVIAKVKSRRKLRVNCVMRTFADEIDVYRTETDCDSNEIPFFWWKLWH